MFFENDKPRFIIISLFYSLILIAAGITLGYGVLYPDLANANDVMLLLLSLLSLGLPYFIFLVEEKISNGFFGGIIRLIVNIIIYVSLFFMFLYIATDTVVPKFAGVAVGALMACPIQLMLHNSFEKWSSLTLGSILVFALPSLTFAAGFFIQSTFNIYVALMICGAFMIFHVAYLCSFTSSSLSVIFGLLATLLYVIASITFGITKSEILNYAENPINGLVFLPILLVVFFIPVFISMYKCDVDGELYVKIMCPTASVLLAGIQILIITKWWLGLIFVLVLLITVFILNGKFGSITYTPSSSRSSGSSYSGSSGYDDWDLCSAVDNEISRHLSTFDSVNTTHRRSGSVLEITATLTYYDGVDGNDYSHYRTCMNSWIGKFSGYASKMQTPTSSIRINVYYTHG